MGIISCIAPNSFLAQTFFPPSSTFDPQRDMPDLTGQIILVTGGNSGIGLETIYHLLLKGATVYMTCRSLSKGQAANEELKKRTGGREAKLLQLDLADLSSVRRAAENFLGMEGSLDVLFNNAGIMSVPVDQLTAQGYDAQFGTNVLGHYFFTTLLLPALSASAQATGHPARVINTSSALAQMAPSTPSGIEYRSLKDKADGERSEVVKKLGTNALYAQSKLGNILLSHHLNALYSSSLSSCAIHPGVLRSNLGKEHSNPVEYAVSRALFFPIEMGPLTQLWAGTMGSAEGARGKCFIPWAREGAPLKKAEIKENQEELGRWLEEQVKGY
ncbi:NAD(P)-binding protein [Leucosporidium creatinivorum]|uniref:NAD(P)-binding protein n=1 Tax=Leucosporidium creatinivorum TaxID=106004 RepID=A0A1Y2FN37_9BASI|nr:NAD(P)-binding protein [Leucosporidium creatinivorum]